MTSPDDLRIGDAERDAAMTALREHYAQGRLTHEELDERLELVLSARTGRDLALAGADLPDLYGSHPGRPEGRDGAVGDGERPPWGGHAGPGAWRGTRGRPRHHRGWADPRPAAWHHHRMGHRSGPRAFLLLLVALIAVTAVTGFAVFKFILVAWLAMAVLGMSHRGRRNYLAEAHARRLGRRGAH